MHELGVANAQASDRRLDVGEVPVAAGRLSAPWQFVERRKIDDLLLIEGKNQIHKGQREPGGIGQPHRPMLEETADLRMPRVSPGNLEETQNSNS